MIDIIIAEKARQPIMVSSPLQESWLLGWTPKRSERVASIKKSE